MQSGREGQHARRYRKRKEDRKGKAGDSYETTTRPPRPSPPRAMCPCKRQPPIHEGEMAGG